MFLFCFTCLKKFYPASDQGGSLSSPAPANGQSRSVQALPRGRTYSPCLILTEERNTSSQAHTSGLSFPTPSTRCGPASRPRSSCPSGARKGKRRARHTVSGENEAASFRDPDIVRFRSGSKKSPNPIISQGSSGRFRKITASSGLTREKESPTPASLCLTRPRKRMPCLPQMPQQRRQRQFQAAAAQCSSPGTGEQASQLP